MILAGLETQVGPLLHALADSQESTIEAIGSVQNFILKAVPLLEEEAKTSISAKDPPGRSGSSQRDDRYV